VVDGTNDNGSVSKTTVPYSECSRASHRLITQLLSFVSSITAGDTNFAGEASMLHFDLAPIYSNWVKLASDSQLRPPSVPSSSEIMGSIGDYAPNSVGRQDAGHTNWASGFVNMVYFVWHLHGDTAVIERNLIQLERYIRFNERIYNSSTDGLRGFSGGCINGWITIGKKPSCNVMTGFAFVNDYRVMAEMTAAVGAASAPRYASLFKARLREFHSAFFHAQNSTYGHGTQSELAMALWLGVPPTPAIHQAVAANLAGQIEVLIQSTANLTSEDVANGCRNSTKHCPVELNFVGGVGLVYLFEALARSGHASTALKLALKTSYPSYGYMFRNQLEQSTTLWELWDSDRGNPTMSSRNHIYSASISTFLYKYLGGIQATRPGYASVLVAPCAGSSSASALHTVAASVGTPYGAVQSTWTTHIPPPPNHGPDHGCSTSTASVCDIQEEGNCPTCAKVCVGCGGPSGVIDRIVFADFASASPDVRPRLDNCSQASMHGTTCGGGKLRPNCHVCANCPPCNNGKWPNASDVVARMCVGRQRCAVPVDFTIFGDTCVGKKVLAVKVHCNDSSHNPKPAAPPTVVIYRHTVTIPVGVTAEVIVPLFGNSPSNVSISEQGHQVWRDGSFVRGGAEGVTSSAAAADGLHFIVVQGYYVFELRV
jgi:hypothetical protein